MKDITELLAVGIVQRCHLFWDWPIQWDCYPYREFFDEKFVITTESPCVPKTEFHLDSPPLHGGSFRPSPSEHLRPSAFHEEA